MEAARRVYPMVDCEGTFSKLADKWMAKRREIAPPHDLISTWDKMRPLLASGWISPADLERQCGVAPDYQLRQHAKELQKRTHSRTEVQYRLKAKP
jgi:hypothetical protein